MDLPVFAFCLHQISFTAPPDPFERVPQSDATHGERGHLECKPIQRALGVRILLAELQGFGR